MKLMNYLSGGRANHCESDELSESSLSSIEQRNSLTRPRQLMGFGDHCFAKIEISSNDWIDVEADIDLPYVDVDSYKEISSLAESIMLDISKNDRFRIKLSLNQDSIKFLTRSLKLVKDRLESTPSTNKRKWQSKVNSYLESIKRYDEIDHRSSTDESESENDSEVCKQTKIVSNFDNDHGAGNPIDGIDRTLEKRFELTVPNREDFWIYSRNLIENGQIQEKNFPVNICSYSTDHLDKRLQTSTELNPDPYVFSHVKHKKPLDESDFEQLLVPKMLKETAKRVLKGMSQGKLYNIDIKRLRRIFFGLISKENGKVKCPLCGMVYTYRSSVNEHLESIHTNFACFCGRCGQLFLRSPAARIHKCPSKK